MCPQALPGVCTSTQYRYAAHKRRSDDTSLAQLLALRGLQLKQPEYKALTCSETAPVSAVAPRPPLELVFVQLLELSSVLCLLPVPTHHNDLA